MSVKHGDTIIEVVFAFMVFATVSVASIGIMNSGLNQAQRTLEITMARNEIDAQAEAIRFIHNNCSAEREFKEDQKQFTALWNRITGQHAIEPSKLRNNSVFRDINNYDTCEAAYQAQVYDITHVNNDVAPYVINPRLLQPRSVASTNQEYNELLGKMIINRNATSSVDGNKAKIMRPTTLYPRLTYTTLMFSRDLTDGAGVDRGTTNEDTLAESRIFREVYSAEGIWVFTVQGEKTGAITGKPQYYDFYIRTCWQSLGAKAPSTVNTIVRLYNPEVID